MLPDSGGRARGDDAARANLDRIVVANVVDDGAPVDTDVAVEIAVVIVAIVVVVDVDDVFVDVVVVAAVVVVVVVVVVVIVVIVDVVVDVDVELVAGVAMARATVEVEAGRAVGHAAVDDAALLGQSSRRLHARARQARAAYNNRRIGAASLVALAMVVLLVVLVALPQLAANKPNGYHRTVAPDHPFALDVKPRELALCPLRRNFDFDAAAFSFSFCSIQFN